MNANGTKNHNIRNSDFPPTSLSLCETLDDAGYDAWIVGGALRDLLAGEAPKDVDIVTTATPTDIKQLFGRKCQLIGKRFRLAHVYLYERARRGDAKGNKRGRRTYPVRFEVSTLRAQGEDNNLYGTSVIEDAARRDFTINALYYQPKTQTLTDPFKGTAHIETRTLHFVGDAVQRITDDPVRLLRAVRFQAKLGFHFDTTCLGALDLATLFHAIAPARLTDELLKLFHQGHALRAYEALDAYDLMAALFPNTPHHAARDALLREGLRQTDARVATGRTVSAAFLMALLLWSETMKKADYAKTISAQNRITRIPKFWGEYIVNIWRMQHRLLAPPKAATTSHPAFRAGYDLLLYRAASAKNSAVQEASTRWTAYLDNR